MHVTQEDIEMAVEVRGWIVSTCFVSVWLALWLCGIRCAWLYHACDAGGL
jgi:hypothetical protein